MSNFSDNVDHVSAQQHRYRTLGGRAPGVDRLAVLERMFGRPPVDPRHHYGENVNYTNYDLFDLYKGKNMYLRDTIEGYILEDIEWYTRVMPWLETSDQHIKFNTFQFQTTLATPVPNEGISRLLSSSSRTFEDSVERYGIGFIMEGDLLGTPEGEQQYRRNIAGIAQCCQETVNYHTLVALLVCKNYYREMQDLYNEHRLTQERIEEREAARFAALALNEETFDRMVVEEQMRIQRHRGRADTLIVFKKFPWNESMVRQGSMTRYYQLGPDGRARFVEGPQSNGTFRGEIPIFETREFSVYDNGERADPLVRDIAVGEYYGMLWGDYRGRMYKNFETDHRSIYLYDFNADDYRKLTFIEALLESKTWGGDESDPDGLSPATKQLAARINAQLAQTGAFDAFKKYENPAKFEHLVGESHPERSLYMMLGVDVKKMEVFPADYLGQLDVDVYTTKDLRDAAGTAAEKMFGGVRDCLEYCEEIDNMFSLLKEWEAQEYKAEYFKALAAKNIGYSVDAQLKFVGEKAGVTQWASNAYGGLDLPAFVDEATSGVYPGGMANWPGLQTFVAQAESKGWADAGSKGAAVLEKAAKAVDTVKTVAGRMHDFFAQSRLLHSDYTPEWFRPKKDTELAVFDMLYVTRQPLFLKAPTTGVAQKSRTEDKDGRPSTFQPKFTGPNDGEFLSALPIVSYIDFILAKGARAGTYTSGETGKLSAFFAQLSDRGINADLAKTEDARTKLTNALYKRIFAHNNDETIAAAVVRETAAQVETQFIVDAANQATVDRAVALAKKLDASTAKIVRQAKKEYSDANAAGKKEIEEAGTAILEAEQESAAKAQYQGAAPFAMANVPDAIARGVQEAVPGGTQNYLEAVRAAREELERLGRKYQAIAKFGWSAAQQKKWAKALVDSKKLTDAELGELGTASEAHKRAIAALDAKVAETAASDSSLSSIEASFLDAGEAITPTKAFFFRAPLTMTATLLRGISRVDEPEILPADSRTGFRTPINLWSTGGNGAAPFGKIQPILGHPMLAGADMGNKFHPKAKSFFNTSYAAALTTLPEISDEAMGLHEYRAPASVVPGLVGDLIDVDFREADEMYGAPAYRTASDLFAARRTEAEQRRAAAGLGPRGYDRDIIEAARRQREQQRAADRESELVRHREMAATKAAMHSAGSSDYQAQAAALERGRTAMSSAGAMLSRNPLSRFRAMSSALAAGAHDGEEGRDEAMQAMANQSYQIQVSPALKKIVRGHFAYRWNKVHEESDPVLRMIMSAILLMPNRMSSWLSMAEKDVNPLCNILVHRPFIELRMYTCILLQSGYEMGFNVIGPSNMAISSTSGDKMIHGSFTFHHASMVVNEKLVSHLRDVYPMGVRAGWGTHPIRTPSEIYEGEERGDWMSTLIPITENKIPRRINLIDTTVSRFLPPNTNRTKGVDKTPNYSAAAWFELVWNLNESNINWQIDLHKYHKQSEMINVRESVGKHWRYDPSTRRFSRLVEGAGQLSGNRTGRGVKNVWLGYAEQMFPDQSQIAYNLP